MEKILADYGWCKVIEREGQFYISHDVGGIAVQMREDKVTMNEALDAANDEKNAQQITIELIKRSRK